MLTPIALMRGVEAILVTALPGATTGTSKSSPFSLPAHPSNFGQVQFLSSGGPTVLVVDIEVIDKDGNWHTWMGGLDFFGVPSQVFNLVAGVLYRLNVTTNTNAGNTSMSGVLG